MNNLLISLFICFGVLFCGAVAAQHKVLATSAAVQFEGAAGGGLVPWAVIGGYGSDNEWGAAASLSRVNVDDFVLNTGAVLVGINNRLELSFAQQNLLFGSKAKAMLNQTLGGVQFDHVIEQQVFGAKARLYGDLIYGAAPQISAGLQYKINQTPFIPLQVLQANSDTGTDYYVSASKLYLDAVFGRSLLLNGTARYTDANQAGLLGFGSPNGADAQWVAEAAVGLFLNHHWAVGAEYRQKPNRLATVDENNWSDFFVAWFPSKRVSVVAAYTDLGTIAMWEQQRGWYLSVQLNN